METIISEIRSSFNNLTEKPKKTFTHRGVDDGGKSTVTQVSFEFENRDAIQIQCYNFSVEAGDQNHLRIGINTYDYRYFLSNKAYK